MTRPVSTIFKSRLLRSTSIYTFAGIINGTAIFFLMPVLTRVLDQEQYGLLSMFRVLVSFAFPFIGFYASIGRQYYEKDNIDFAQYVTNSISIVIFNATAIGIILWVFGESVTKLTAFPSEWLWCVVVFALGKALMQTILVLWQVQIKPLIYGIFQISQTILMFMLSIAFVVVFEWGWQGGVWADTLAMGLYGILAIIFLKKDGWIKFSHNSDYLKDILVFNTPLIFHSLGRGIITMSDRIFITNMEGLADTGLYSAGYQIGMILFLMASSFNNAWTPHFYSKLKKNDEKENRKIVRFTYLYFLALIAMALGLGLIAPWFTRIFLGSEFSDSSLYVIWVAVGFAFNGMYWIMAGYIYYLKRTYIIAATTVFSAILNIILNYILIKENGAIGAAQATALTFLIVFLITWIISTRIYKMPWKLYKKE